MTFTSGIGVNTRWLGWGCGFLDVDNDGWLDILLVNGHVYPEVEKLTTEAGYAQRKVLYRNLRDRTFMDITEKIGGALIEPTASRGCAFGDFDNDGDLDVVIDPVNDVPVLMRCDAQNDGNNWVAVRAIGVKSNRSGIGASSKCLTGDRTQNGRSSQRRQLLLAERSARAFRPGQGERRSRQLKYAGRAVRWILINDLNANQSVQIKEGAGIVKPTAVRKEAP